MAIVVGDVVYLNYGEVPACTHARLVLSEVDRNTHEYVILTPDYDVYVEILDASNPDLASFHLSGPGGSLPPGVPRAQIYGFAAMSAVDYARFMARGRAEAAAEVARRGAVPVAAPVGPAVAGGGAADGGHQIWVMAETCGVHKIGETVVPPAGLPMLQDFGLMVVNDSDGVGRPCLIKRIDPDNLAQFCEDRIGLARASESIDGEDRVAADDIRTMSVKYTANGERFRNFRESVGEMTNTEMPDFPYEPRTCLSYLQAVQSVSENCYAQHLAWLQQSKIPEGSRASYEDETLAHILDVAISFDCLCVTNLASFELLVRRRQLIAEAHAYNPSSPSYEGSEYWMGNRFKHGGAIVVPALTEHVAKKLQADSQIMKERRKLEEAKAKGKGKPPKPTKNGGAAGSTA